MIKSYRNGVVDRSIEEHRHFEAATAQVRVGPRIVYWHCGKSARDEELLAIAWEALHVQDRGIA